MVEVVDSVDRYVSEFASCDGSLPGSRLGWLASARKGAIASFAELGFPTLKHEEWRVTNIAPIVETSFRRATPDDARVETPGAERFFYPEVEACRLVFVNGHWAPRLSNLTSVPEGVRVGTLAQLLAEDPSRLEPYVGRLASAQRHSFVALNMAFFEDGPYVLVSKGVKLDRPIHVVYLATGADEPTVNHPRALLIAERETEAIFVETFAGVPSGNKGRSFTNAVTEMSVGAGARVHHAKFEIETLSAFHVATHQLVIASGANVTTHSVSFGGALVRNELNSVLDGEGIWLQMNGLFRVDGTQFIDNHTSIDHLKPHSDSRELYKGLLDGRGRAVFNGKIIVRKDAQLTNAYQENPNLLLSDESFVDTKPQLEIHANDVKCKHGANIGHVREEHIHYLRSRGVSPEAARRILIQAFGAEMIERIPVEAMRTRLAGTLYELLGGDPRDAVLWGA